MAMFPVGTSVGLLEAPANVKLVGVSVSLIENDCDDVGVFLFTVWFARVVGVIVGAVLELTVSVNEP
jgi:hypothetical protein